MSGTLDKKPEYIVLIAVVAALVVGTITAAVSCGTLAGAAGQAVGKWESTHGGTWSGQYPDNGQGQSPYFTEDDVPSQMNIDVPELQDDLQAMINRDLEDTLKTQDKNVTVTELTKDEVGTPSYSNGQIICQVKGKATIKNADGQTATVDYTSYYFAEDPRVQNIVWYIYAYDLSSYDLFPQEVRGKMGDTLGLRDSLLGKPTGADALELGADHARDAQAA